MNVSRMQPPDTTRAPRRALMHSNAHDNTLHSCPLPHECSAKQGLMCVCVCVCVCRWSRTTTASSTISSVVSPPSGAASQLYLPHGPPQRCSN